LRRCGSPSAVPSVQLRIRPQGWLATTPLYGHTLALSNLLLTAFVKIGADAGEAPLPPPSRAQLAARDLDLVLVLLIVLAAPFYNAGMLIGSFLLAGIIFCRRRPRADAVAAGRRHLRVGSLLALHFFEFFAGAKPLRHDFRDPNDPCWTSAGRPNFLELIAAPATDCVHGAWCATG
jgi:hypothetical protein